MAQIPWARFYVCPLCFRAFNELTLTETVDPKERLTEEHVPPESVGGKKMVLTCAACNHEAGTEIDSHMRREADVHDFFLKRSLGNIKANIRTDSGRAPIRLSRSESVIQAAVVKTAMKPEIHKDVVSDFAKTTVEDGWQNLRFKIDFAPYSEPRASTSWLRSAYLAFFAALGYRFICRQELGVVRERIKNPEQESPATFRITRPEESVPLLVLIEAPEAFRSYAMFYGRNVVFLPRYSDHTLYERLAQQPAKLTFSGKQYPWPTDGPTFLDD